MFVLTWIIGGDEGVRKVYNSRGSEQWFAVPSLHAYIQRSQETPRNPWLRRGDGDATESVAP